MNNISKKTKYDCCGCTACENACNHNAITMQPDSMGFLYPVIDSTKCTDCGLCEKVCQFHSRYYRYEKSETPLAYSLRLKDEKQLLRSQSGGAFYALAKSLIEEGGIVYGAAFTNDWKVSHQRVDNIRDLEKLRMSKYVQSDMRGVYAQIKGDLHLNSKVLFAGTACQVAGLKSYLPNRLQDNLYCIDIICHGVPSPKIWEDYLTYLEDKYKSKIMKACFRDKRFGWHGATESFLFNNGREIFRKTNNRLYFSGLSLREACSKCYFTNTKRVGDITIGDCWGLPKNSPFELDKKGVSLVLVNSIKGANLLTSIGSIATMEPVSLENCMQEQLIHPTKLNPKHSQFVHDYTTKGFKYVAEHYSAMGWRYNIEKFYAHIRIIGSKILHKIKLK